MRVFQRTSSGSCTLLPLLLISILTTVGVAQTTDSTTETSLTSATAGTDTSTGSATSATTTNTETSTQTSQSETTSATAASTTASSAETTSSGSASTATHSSASATTTSSGSSSSTDSSSSSASYTYVPASVPPTANAPYMQVSNLPEGTVFIVVGAVLGFFAMSILAWRGLVAWSLHRSVKRSAYQQSVSDTKAAFRTPAAPFYKYADRDSTLSLANLDGTKDKKKSKKSKKSRPITTAPSEPNRQSLFFSPTAGSGLTNFGNRASNYLPAGYYAAGASAPGGGSGMTHIGSGPTISLSNLGPQSQGYSRARSVGPTPPESPNVTPRRGNGHSPSASNLSLNQSRAPSAYLEDVFDDHASSTAPPSRGAGRY